jgi:hypothetical protein
MIPKLHVQQSVSAVVTYATISASETTRSTTETYALSVTAKLEDEEKAGNIRIKSGST